PIAAQAALRNVAAEAGRVRHEASRPDPIAEEERVAAVPRVGEVPDLVTPDDHDVEGLEARRTVQVEATGAGQGAVGEEKAAHLERIPRAVRGATGLWLQRAQSAAPFGALHPPGVMVEKDGVEPARL